MKRGMRRESHVRCCESLEGKFLRATRQRVCSCGIGAIRTRSGREALCLFGIEVATFQESLLYLPSFNAIRATTRIGRSTAISIAFSWFTHEISARQCE